MRTDSLFAIPPDVPIPVDDGAAKHLVGRSLPAVRLRATSGMTVNLKALLARTVVLYCYPRTGRPNEEALGGTASWNAIPGARGCTPQSCGYRDSYEAFSALGVLVYGVSTQPSEDQQEAAKRLKLPFELLSDDGLDLCSSLGLPSFEVAGTRLLKRLTLIIRDGRIVQCFYPVFPADSDAEQVLRWIRADQGSGNRAP